MQIVFRSDSARINFYDMNEEEKLSWFKALENDLLLQKPRLERARKKLEEEKKLVEKKIDNTINWIKDVSADKFC